MTTVKKLYRVMREYRYNGGIGSDRLQSTTVLYCGYDRDEARRVYHENRPADKSGSGPGSYYEQTRCQSMECDD